MILLYGHYPYWSCSSYQVGHTWGIPHIRCRSRNFRVLKLNMQFSCRILLGARSIAVNHLFCRACWRNSSDYPFSYPRRLELAKLRCDNPHDLRNHRSPSKLGILETWLAFSQCSCNFLEISIHLFINLMNELYPKWPHNFPSWPTALIFPQFVSPARWSIL